MGCEAGRCKTSTLYDIFIVTPSLEGWSAKATEPPSPHEVEFIQSFKERIHLKSSCNDNIRMEGLVNVLDEEAKRAVLAIRRNRAFYASSLKPSKREFDNLYTVSYLKLKQILDLPTISLNGNKGAVLLMVWLISLF